MLIMDPKKFATLDPKLKETYERVMGISIPSNPPSSPVASPPPAPPPVPTAPVTNPETIKPNVTHVAPAPVTHVIPSPVHKSEVSQPIGNNKKAIFIILGIIFFGVYLLFWMIYFKVIKL